MIRLIRKLAIRIALSKTERLTTKICCERAVDAMNKAEKERGLEPIERKALESVKKTLEIL